MQGQPPPPSQLDNDLQQIIRQLALIVVALQKLTGVVGPTGPLGPTGPTGPTGP
jgi:hypothetical protein